MNQVTGPLSSASQLLSIFEGGRSPGYWRKQMSRAIEPLGAVQRNSSWVCELAAIDLRLCERPLLGETLSVLTSRNAVTNASAAEPGVTRKAFSESTTARKRELKKMEDLNSDNSSRALEPKVPDARRPAPGSTVLSSPESVESVLQLPPRVGASFLRRIAGDISDFARDRAEAARESESARVQRHSARPDKVAERSQQQQELQTSTSAGKFRSRSAAAVQHSTPIARAGQVELARRVQRVAGRIEAAFNRPSLLTHNLLPAAVARGKVLPAGLQSSLADHWSIPINGPTASADLLRRLASSASLPDRRIGADVEREAPRTDPSSGDRAPVESLPKHARRTGTSSTFHDSRNPEHPQQLVPWNTHAAHPSSSEFDDVAGHTASGFPSEPPLPETNDPERWSGFVPASAQAMPLLTPAAIPTIAPPSVTPSLPPLHSEKKDDVVLPVAAATAQRQARLEEHIARGDDLPLLAERLDRILKQEARRHGIDV